MSRRSILFILWALQGLIALLWLALLPGDAGHGLLFGFSGSRLALMGILLALSGAAAALAWWSRGKEFGLRPGQQDVLIGLCLIGMLGAATTIIVLRALGQTSGFIYAAYAERLAPLAFWLALSALELLLWLAWAERAAISASLRSAHNFYRPVLTCLSVLGIVALFVSLTRIGLTPSGDAGSWGTPTTPLLEWQILLALLAGLGLMSLGPRWNPFKQERWTPLLVYLYTCLLWLSQPVNPGFFATPPRAPNFEIYPFSDALIYAQYVQSALIGHGFLWPDVPTRPLYIAFLTWLHALAGQDYGRVIVLQTLVLAAFPMVLYLLGRELGGRPMGLGLALLAGLRDLTANAAAPFALNYTYSKLFFSEIPAALLLSLFTLMAVRWMRGGRTASRAEEATEVATTNRGSLPARRVVGGAKVATTDWYPLLAGGVLGLCSLIRLQSAFILVAVIPFGFVVMGNRRRWATGSALMVLGTVLAVLPWLARNYQATGGLVFDNPTSQAMVLAQRWSGDTEFKLVQYQPGEGEAAYTQRMMGIALQSFRRDPGRIIGSAIDHFFNNEIGNLLLFPLRDRLEGPGELLWPGHAFWQSWTGRPDGGQTLVIAGYLALLGLGLAAAWFKNGPLGLLPLGISLAYNAWTGLFLSSGDRFLVPVDWAVYFYQFLGLLALVSLVLTSVKGLREAVSAWFCERYGGEAGSGVSDRVDWRRLALTGGLILLLGLCVPLTELAFPRVSPVPAQLVAPGPGQLLLSGRAIYPRYYAAGDGEPGSAKLGYGKTDRARLVFFLIGTQNTLVILPLKSAPDFFPNSGDVTIIGTQQDGFVSGVDVVVQKDGREAEYGK